MSDALNHASIIDGMRLSKAPRKVFPHGDVDALREILREAARAAAAPDGGGPYRLILVVTDGVFSMDGDIAPLPGIVEAAEEVGAAVFVDDAHASGVLGRNGRGSVDHFGLHGRVDDPGRDAVQGGRRRSAATSRARRRCATSSSSAPGRSCSRRPTRRPSPPPAARRSGSCRRSPELHRAAVGEHDAVQGRADAARLRHRPLGDADHAGHRRRLRRPRSGSPAGCSRRACSRPSVVFPTVALDQARLRTIVTAALTRRAPRPGARGVRDASAASSASSAGERDRRRDAIAQSRERRRSVVELDTAGGRARAEDARPAARRPPPHRPVARQRPSRSTSTRAAVERGHRRDRDHRPRRLRPARRPRSPTRVRGSRADVRDAAERWATARRRHPVRRRADLQPALGGRHPGHLRRHRYDYVIGSVHDWPESPYWPDRGVGRWVAGRSLDEVVAPYFAEVIAAARSGLFDTIGHLDFVKRYLHPHVTPADLAHAPELYEPVLRALVESGTALEVNTSGLRYPAPRRIPRPADRGALPRAGGTSA